MSARGLSLRPILLLLAAVLLVPVSLAEPDTMPPETVPGLLGPHVFQSGQIWLGPPTRIALTLSDDASGVAGTFYTVDDGATQVYVGPFGLTGPSGPRTVRFWSEDAAGNVEEPHAETFRLDADAPTVAFSSPRANTTYWWPGFVTDANGTTLRSRDGDVFLPVPLRQESTGAPVVRGCVDLVADAADALVGVKQVTFLRDGVHLTTDPVAPFAYTYCPPASALGMRDVTAVALDRVGNTASTTMTIDFRPAP